jgi:hypothetical protein
MAAPVVTLNKDKILVVDNILSNEEAVVLALAAQNRPTQPSDPDLYLWSELYSMERGNALPFTHEARNVMEQVQFRIMQLMESELGLPRFKMQYSGIAISSKGFNYHADAVWPADEDKRFMGTPTEAQGDYSTFIDRSNDEWVPNYVPARFYTSVLYLNADFQGGHTIFPQHNIDVTPRQGRFVAFPCGREHIHGVRPSRGYRFAFNTWYEKVFTYQDQKAHESTKNLENVFEVVNEIQNSALTVTVV